MPIEFAPGAPPRLPANGGPSTPPHRAVLASARRMGRTFLAVSPEGTRSEAPGSAGYAPAPLGRQATVLLVGPYSPPHGGVSTHVRRLSEALAADGFTTQVVNHFGRRPDPIVVDALHGRAPLYWWRLRRHTADVVHYHHGGRLLTLLGAALARRSGRPDRWVVTIHGHPLRRFLNPKFGPLSWAARWALRRFDEVIAVSDEIAGWLYNFDSRLRITVSPAYIPPTYSEIREPDERLRSIIGMPGVTMAMSAYRIDRWSGGGDVYGVDIAVATLLELSRLGQDVRLALFLAHEPRRQWAKRYWRRLVRCVEAAGLTDRLHVFIGQPLLPALRPEVIYLRPSRIDGDAVSIREALDLGVSVLASDAVDRPKGVRTLPTADVSAWTTAIIEEACCASTIPCESGFDVVGTHTALYDRLINDHR